VRLGEVPPRLCGLVREIGQQQPRLPELRGQEQRPPQRFGCALRIASVQVTQRDPQVEICEQRRLFQRLLVARTRIGSSSSIEAFVTEGA